MTNSKRKECKACGTKMELIEKIPYYSCPECGREDNIEEEEEQQNQVNSQARYDAE